MWKMLRRNAFKNPFVYDGNLFSFLPHRSISHLRQMRASFIPPNSMVSTQRASERRQQTTRRIPSSSMNQTIFEMQIHPIVKSSWTLCMTKFILYFSRYDKLSQRLIYVWCHAKGKRYQFGLVGSAINYLAMLEKKTISWTRTINANFRYFQFHFRLDNRLYKRDCLQRRRFIMKWISIWNINN